MNYPELKRSHDEMTEAITRHNEQVAKQITAEVFGDKGEAYEAQQSQSERIDQAQQQQNILIQQAREALHRGNYDDVKKILEML